MKAIEKITERVGKYLNNGSEKWNLNPLIYSEDGWTKALSILNAQIRSNFSFDPLGKLYVSSQEIKIIILLYVKFCFPVFTGLNACSGI